MHSPACGVGACTQCLGCALPAPSHQQQCSLIECRGPPTYGVLSASTSHLCPLVRRSPPASEPPHSRRVHSCNAVAARSCLCTHVARPMCSALCAAWSTALNRCAAQFTSNHCSVLQRATALPHARDAAHTLALAVCTRPPGTTVTCRHSRHMSSEVHACLQANRMAHLQCQGCRTWLMYAYGARSVKCAICEAVTHTAQDTSGAQTHAQTQQQAQQPAAQDQAQAALQPGSQPQAPGAAVATDTGASAGAAPAAQAEGAGAAPTGAVGAGAGVQQSENMPAVVVQNPPSVDEQGNEVSSTASLAHYLPLSSYRDKCRAACLHCCSAVLVRSADKCSLRRVLCAP